MDEAVEDRGLLEWAFAAFHTGVFVLALVFFLHLRGALGAVLASLNTLAGIAMFGVVWAVTGWSTRRGLQRLARSTSGAGTFSVTGVKLGDALVQALVWGGVTGLLFFAGLVLYTLVFVLLPNMASAPIAAGVLLVDTGLGGVVAFVIGALSGLVLGLIDGILVSVARELVN
jgi:hypothetical protein